jgi:microcystin-dependent protein
MEGIVGYITMFAGNFAPANWAFCNGQILPIAQYQALYSLLGTYYGGNGVSTFALPNLQGKAVVGVGQSPFNLYKLGQTGGNELYPINTAQMPAHQHTITIELQPACGAVANSSSPQNAFYGVSNSNLYNFSSNTPMQTFTAPVTLASTGNMQPVNTLHPVLGLNYIICLSGLFPKKPGND